MKLIVAIVALSLAVLFPACSKSTNLLLGRVEAKIGTHAIVVTDCYKTSVPEPETYKDSADNAMVHRFKPCLDAEIVIRGEELIVNGISYGLLSGGDAVTVDHGKVLVNEREARPIK